jgi:hypothetical protein
MRDEEGKDKGTEYVGVGDIPMSLGVPSERKVILKGFYPSFFGLPGSGRHCKWAELNWLNFQNEIFFSLKPVGSS